MLIEHVRNMMILGMKIRRSLPKSQLRVQLLSLGNNNIGLHNAI